MTGKKLTARKVGSTEKRFRSQTSDGSNSLFSSHVQSSRILMESSVCKVTTIALKQIHWYIYKKIWFLIINKWYFYSEITWLWSNLLVTPRECLFKHIESHFETEVCIYIAQAKVLSIMKCWSFNSTNFKDLKKIFERNFTETSYQNFRFMFSKHQVIGLTGDPSVYPGKV